MQVIPEEINENLSDNHANNYNIESELKEYRRRKFEADNLLEQKMFKLNQLTEENHHLQNININLRNNLKENFNISHIRRPSIMLKKNSQEEKEILNFSIKNLTFS